jgi:Xaa-Pro dipeptidase
MMTAAEIDVILITYSRSLLYYTGTTQPSICIITPGHYHLFVIRAFESALEESRIDPDRISEGGQLPDLKPLLSQWAIQSGRMGLELDILPALQYKRISETFPDFEPVDVSRLLLDQRKIKDQEEIDHTRKACHMLHQGHLRILETLREGMTELELSSEIEDAHRRAGHEGLYFIRQFDFFMGRGPIASGINISKIAGKVVSVTGVGLSPSIPMGASRKPIKRGEMIVVDIPTHFKGYHGDQSRTYVLGDPPDICRRMHDAMKEIADRLTDMMRPGIRCNTLYERALAFSEACGMGAYFMRLGTDSIRVPFIGHGVGIELNEPPLLGPGCRDVLEEGMVLALELEMSAAPGRVVKLEDMLRITSGGVEFLTITPRELHRI